MKTFALPDPARYSAPSPGDPDRSRDGDRDHQQIRAFTLTELITVIAVIGILATLLLPALASARRRALAVRSVSNVRQLGLGIHLYSQDYSQLPRDPREPGASNWTEALSPYLAQLSGVRVCPADPFREARRRAGSSGYVLNFYTAGAQPNSFNDPNGDSVYSYDPNRNVDTFPRPSETFLLFEASNAGVVPGPNPSFDDHTHPDTWLLGWGHVLADIDPFRHGAGANNLFADWHVETTPELRLRKRIEAGDNFAEIPH